MENKLAALVEKRFRELALKYGEMVFKIDRELWDFYFDIEVLSVSIDKLSQFALWKNYFEDLEKTLKGERDDED